MKKYYWLSRGCILALLISCFALVSIALAEGENNRIMVTLGDSYSSGEGIEPFYDQEKGTEEKVNSPDWVAHRSKNSWPGMLKLPGMSNTMADYKTSGNWVFSATSGATTHNLNHPQTVNLNYITFSFTGLKKNSGSFEIEPQLQKLRELKDNGKTIDYVTITIGGNDADFAGIIISAALGNRYILSRWLEDKIENVWYDFDKEIRSNLLQAYRDIEEAAGKQAKIIVAGYPGLLNPEGSKGVFDPFEAQYIDYQVELFNQEIEKLVNECRSEGMNIYFAPVMSEFYGHEAYTEEPFINRVIVGANFEDINTTAPTSAYSMHPNKKGADAYKTAVQRVIDEIEDGVGSDKSWSNAYKDFVLNDKYLTYDSSLKFFKETVVPQFGLYDMDKDSIPELIIYNGCHYMADATDYVFTFKEGEIKYLGNVGFRECGLHYYESESCPGLFCSDGNWGYITSVYYGISDGKIYSEDIAVLDYNQKGPDGGVLETRRTSNDDLYLTKLSKSPIYLKMFEYSEIQSMGWDNFLQNTDAIM